MALRSKDSAVARAAAARRRQRVVSTPPESEPAGTRSDRGVSWTDQRAAATTAAASRAAAAGDGRQQQSRSQGRTPPSLRPSQEAILTAPAASARPSSSSRRPATTVDTTNDDDDDLLERSFDVAEEAASVLALVRESKSPSSVSSRSGTKASPPALTPTTATQRRSRVGVEDSSAFARSTRPDQSPVVTKRTSSSKEYVPVRSRAQTSTGDGTSSSARGRTPPKPQRTSVRATASPQPRRSSSRSAADGQRAGTGQPPSSPPRPSRNARKGPDEEDDPEEEDDEEVRLVKATIEELEETLDEQSHASLLDAACYPDESRIMLLSHAAEKNLTAIEEDATDGEDAVFQAGLTGNSLGLESELLQLFVLTKHSSNSVLCYGDRAVLRCKDDLALGVRLVSRKEGGAALQVGFFRAVAGKAEQWTIIRSRSDGTAVRVGQAAAATRPPGLTAPVRCGDPILLRNCQTGGVLSCIRDGQGVYSLKLLTDSHDADRARHDGDPRADPSLLTRLHYADRLVPSESETFHLLPATFPPVPLWISGCGNSHSTVRKEKRWFLDGSYLTNADRHKMSASAQKALFGEVGSLSSVMVEHADHMETERREQLRIPQAQESLLIDELIGSFLGLEGQFIKTVMDEGASPLNRAAMHGFQFQLLEPESEEVRFGTILRNVAEQVLPLATSFARVRYFIAQHEPGYEYGSAMQAFCEAVNRMIQDHISAMSSLDGHYRRQDLTLRTLQVHVRPSMHSMSVLERACDAVRQKKGGALINALRELKLQCYEGDETADRILQALQDAAAVPYLTTLRQWLESGVLSDPYEEFMVQRNSGSETWEDKFEVVEDHVLEGFFSTQQTVDRVLATGRYWHAVRSWQQSEKVSKEKKESEATIADLRYSMNFATVSAYVGNLYQKASRALVMLLMEDFDLIDSLRIAKRYFLLEYGDLFVNFLDAAEEELLKDVQHLSQGRIQHWLNVSVQMTEHSGEAEGSVGTPQRRRRTITPSGIRCRFAGESLLGHLDQLHSASGGIDTHDPWTPVRHTYGGSVTSSEDITGLDAFVIDFASVPFPTSLVFSRQALACYQLLFRHLFFAKHVERRLVSIWRDHQSMKELQSLRGSMGPTFLLRQRMLHFLQNLIYYMMFEVIEPNWLEMESAISASLTSKEQTVDDILRHHGQFLRRALEACLLTNRDLVRALTKIMKTCLLFTDQMKRFMKATKIEEDRNFVATEKQKLVHRNLNARGGTRTSRLSYKRLHETMVNDRIERQRRVHRQTVRVEREVSGESYQRMVTRFEEVFSDNLREFMVQLTRSDDLFHTHKVNLCVRLDYNGYVTDAMGLNER